MASTSSEAPLSSPSETPTINNSTKSKPLEKADQKGKKTFENNHHNAASSSGITNEDDKHGGAISPSSEMIQKDLLLLDSALMKYMHHTNEKINQVREKFKELLKLPSSERNFDEVQKAIKKLEDQIPSLENNHHNAASSSGTTNEDNSHGGALSHSSTIQKDLLLLDSALMEYMHHTYGTINQVREKFKELPTFPSSESDFDEVQKAITKLKGRIPSHRSSDSKSQHREWPKINEFKEEMMHFPEVKQTVDLEFARKKAFAEPLEPWHRCLLCFFWFPPEKIIKRTTMIYLWIGQGYIPQPDDGKKIFDELIAKHFIERCSLVPNSCMMRHSVHSFLSKQAKDHGFTSNGAPLNGDFLKDCGCLAGSSCLINIDKAIINKELKIDKNVENIQSLHLGRWQSSAKYHIELEDIKILDRLQQLRSLKFLSLRGISMITELPTSILELNCLEILDLRDCHNLEGIPDNIGLLKRLTHLDMSECYFLEHMPKSLAQLSNLEVLKGFFIGHLKNKKQSCNLHDLSKLSKMRKLNIYTSVKEFPTMSDLDDLQEFEGLLKLTISWGTKIEEENQHLEQTRRKLQEKIDGRTAALKLEASRAEGLQTLHLRLQKLDLQGLPMESLPHWLRPANLKELKKLYIRGGNLCKLGQLQERPGEKWKVEILRLKYLSKLEIDWNQLRSLFPELIYLHQQKCPKLTSFQFDEISGVWMVKKDIDTRFWLQKFFKTDGISLSSLVGYGPNLGQDDSNVCPVD